MSKYPCAHTYVHIHVYTYKAASTYQLNAPTRSSERGHAFRIEQINRCFNAWSNAWITEGINAWSNEWINECNNE